MLTYRLRIGRFLGIGLFVHWTFSLLLLWIGFSAWQAGENWSAIAFQIGVILSVFACVTLHEYGHALAARRFGIATRDITLLPIGGVARLERIPREAYQELIIAVAGPLVNVFIAGIVIAGGFFLGVPLWSTLLETEATVSWMTYFQLLLWVNLALVAFNMLPAFPMDGGRVLRSLLAMRWSYARATKIASRIGFVVAVAIALIGMVYTTDIRLALLAMFVIWAGSNETRQVVWHERAEGLKVGDLISTKIWAVDGDATVREVLQTRVDNLQRDWPVSYGAIYHAMLPGSVLAAAAQRGELNRCVRDLPLVMVDPLRPEEDLANAFSMGAKIRTLPVVDEELRILGLLDLDLVGTRIAMRRAMPADSLEMPYQEGGDAMDARRTQ